MLTDDDVLDYMVMEAVAIKVGKLDESAREDDKFEQWKKDKSSLDKLR